MKLLHVSPRGHRKVVYSITVSRLQWREFTMLRFRRVTTFWGLNSLTRKRRSAFWMCTAPDMPGAAGGGGGGGLRQNSFWLRKKVSEFLFAVKWSQAQEFYSLIVLNVPCWLSQGLLQRLDPRAVWVYGLRFMRRGTPRYAKPTISSRFSFLAADGLSSVYVSRELLLIFMCFNFNQDL